MGYFGLHLLDWLVLATYFGLVIYLGVFLGSKQTKNLGDFFVAGGQWGPLVSFIFVFASALAGNEAVAVSGASYKAVGLAGFWMWGSFIFATPIYFLFSTYYRRARVYNLAEFLEMRYGTNVAALYALVAGTICVLFIGMFLLAVGRILGGSLDINVQPCIWTIALVVALYVFAGGMMSTLLTDLLQGLMCLVILGFLFLPYLWNAAGGYEALKALPDETWNFTGPGMGPMKVLAMCLTTAVGGIAAPWIYNWIAVSKNEKTATQCAWAHLWKRVATLFFSFYGILFAIVLPATVSPDMAWGVAMKKVLPPGAMGLMIASFFAAAMSSAATYATISAAMFIDYVYRRLIDTTRRRETYLSAARWWSVASIIAAAASTHQVGAIGKYVELCLSLLCFLGTPIYFGVVWRRANQLGMWLSLLLGIGSFLVIKCMPTGEGHYLPDADTAFSYGVFISTGLSLVGMLLGSWLGPREDDAKLDRFHVILNTPIGDEARLVQAGIKLPAMIDAGLVPEGPEVINAPEVTRLHRADAQAKIFGPASNIEVRRERLPWYTRGFVLNVFACVGLVVLTWFVTRVCFVWG